MANESVIRQWEAFLATSPLGVSYTKGQTGKLSDELSQAVQQLQTRIRHESGNPNIWLNVLVSPQFAKQQIQEIQEKQKAQPPPAEAPKQTPVTAQGELVKAWKKHLGVANPEDPNPSPAFISAIVAAENKLAEIPTVKGLIWNPNKQEVNPQIPPAEYQAALQLFQQSKKTGQKQATAHATMDALGPPPTREERPSATKFVLSDEDTKIETGDPMQTQMQGITVNKIPRRKRRKRRLGKPLSLDDRIIKLVELMEKTKNT